MAINIERLLRLTADYHHFCNDDPQAESAGFDDELTEDFLDFVAAARMEPEIFPGGKDPE